MLTLEIDLEILKISQTIIICTDNWKPGKDLENFLGNSMNEE